MMILYVLILLLTIYLLIKNRSSFTNLESEYAQPSSCGLAQGHLPGSNIILTPAEKSQLLQRFAE